MLKEYLLSLDLDEQFGEETPLSIPNELPEKFQNLLKRESYIKKLWNNKGKTGAADLSRSGYDFSIARECIKQGITDINKLITILALRPEGAFQKSGKGEQYLKRTVGKAIYR